MRLSMIEGDPGYDDRLPDQRVVIFFNGEEMSYVLTADEEAGILVRYKRDANGHYIANPQTGDAVTETLYGGVKIDCPWR